MALVSVPVDRHLGKEVVFRSVSAARPTTSVKKTIGAAQHPQKNQQSRDECLTSMGRLQWTG